MTRRELFDPDTADMSEFRNRLKKARLANNFKGPTEAARAKGWVVSTYLGYENTDRPPSREAAQRIASAFRVSLDWLLENRGHMELPARFAPAIGPRPGKPYGKPKRREDKLAWAAIEGAFTAFLRPDHREEAHHIAEEIVAVILEWLVAPTPSRQGVSEEDALRIAVEASVSDLVRQARIKRDEASRRPREPGARAHIQT